MSSVSSSGELSKIKVSWKLLELAIGARSESGFVRVVLCESGSFKLYGWLKLLQHHWAQENREDVK